MSRIPAAGARRFERLRNTAGAALKRMGERIEVSPTASMTYRGVPIAPDAAERVAELRARRDRFEQIDPTDTFAAAIQRMGN